MGRGLLKVLIWIVSIISIVVISVLLIFAYTTDGLRFVLLGFSSVAPIFAPVGALFLAATIVLAGACYRWTFRKVAFSIALTVSIAGVLYTSLYFIIAYHLGASWWEVIRDGDFAILPLAPVGILFLTALTAFSGVYFGWRKDRREAHDQNLKAMELGLKLKELEIKLQEYTKKLESMDRHTKRL